MAGVRSFRFVPVIFKDFTELRNLWIVEARWIPLMQDFFVLNGPGVKLLAISFAARFRLVGFEQVELKPDESRQVKITADPRLLARFDGKANQSLSQARIDAKDADKVRNHIHTLLRATGDDLMQPEAS